MTTPPRETPLEHLRRIHEEAIHRELDRIDRAQRMHECRAAVKRTVSAPFRWIYNVMTGMP